MVMFQTLASTASRTSFARAWNPAGDARDSEGTEKGRDISVDIRSSVDLAFVRKAHRVAAVELLVVLDLLLLIAVVAVVTIVAVGSFAFESCADVER